MSSLFTQRPSRPTRVELARALFPLFDELARRLRLSATDRTAVLGVEPVLASDLETEEGFIGVFCRRGHDRILKIIELDALLRNCAIDPADLPHWILAPKPELRDQSPLDMMSSSLADISGLCRWLEAEIGAPPSAAS